MKKYSLIRLTSLALTGLMMTTLGNLSAKEKMPMAKMASPQVANVDPAASTLAWVGKKVTGQHNGAIKIKDGKIMLSKDSIVGGVFNIDMTSITVEDLKDAEYNQKLVGHLKSEDFFGSEKNPVATFTLTEAKSLAAGQANGATHEIKGTLTITRQCGGRFIGKVEDE